MFIMTILYFIMMLPVLAFVGYMLYSRSKYRNKAGAGEERDPVR